MSLSTSASRLVSVAEMFPLVDVMKSEETRVRVITKRKSPFIWVSVKRLLVLVSTQRYELSGSRRVQPGKTSCQRVACQLEVVDATRRDQTLPNRASPEGRTFESAQLEIPSRSARLKSR